MRLDADGLVCDLDGVVYRGDEAIPGAAAALARLQERGIKVVFCTNNSRSTVAQYVAKLTQLGVPAAPDQVLTSAVVATEVLRARGASGSAVVIGGDGLDEAVRDAGLRVLGAGDTGRADYVLVGWDPDFTYDAMRRASLAVTNGAQLIATNADASFPAAGNEQWPGAGAILASIETATGRRAEVLGKPEKPMLAAAQRRLDGAGRIAVVGDRAETDLAGGREMGWTTILVLTGVVTDASNVDPSPDIVIESLAEVE